VKFTNAGLPNAKAEIELDVTLNGAAEAVVFTPKALSIPVLQNMLEGMLLDDLV